jgi:hypothetical protein
MSIADADKIVALLAGLSPESIEGLPPGERRRFAAACRRAASLAEPAPRAPHQMEAAVPSSGVLASLGDPSNPRHG